MLSGMEAALKGLLAGVIETRGTLDRRIPVFLKIAPDLSDAEISDVAEVAETAGVDAIIATNTTLSREGLRSRQAGEAGGLSGKPLLARLTEVLAQLYRETHRELPLIGVGGIFSADDAWAKLRAGATAVQLYSALIFQGFSLAGRMAEELDLRLRREKMTLPELTGSGI